MVGWSGEPDDMPSNGQESGSGSESEDDEQSGNELSEDDEEDLDGLERH